MSDVPLDTPSITDRLRTLAPGAPVVAAGFLGDAAAFVLGDEAVLLVDPDGTERRVTAHRGGILAAAFARDRVVTGGDDGVVAETKPDGTTATLARDEKRRWIDTVALARDGTLAWSAGKQVFVRTPKGRLRSVEMRSTPGGLAFAPKGLRLAIAHYGGVSLWFPNADAAPHFMEWKGSHLGVTFSPDGRYLVTAMLEPTLHAWRLADGKHMRMSGYASKVRAMAWTADGRELATSGATTLVVWPFHGKDGPTNQQPRLLAPTQAKVTAAACHPADAVAAVGYEDGLVLLVRLGDGAEIVARRPGEGAVTALAWDATGKRLAIGTEGGAAGLVAL